MKNAIKLFVAVAVLAIAGIASAQNSASTNATASARIIKPITITKVSDLQFGNIISGAGTLTVKAGTTPVYSNPALKPGSQVGVQTAAQFTMTGEPTFTYTITSSPALGGTIVITDGTNAAGHTANVVLASNATDNTGTNLPTPALDPSGTANFYIGGVLTVTAANISGNYSNANTGGTPWSVTVAY
jgi:hypothetical protein